MTVDRTTETTPFDLVLTQHPRNTVMGDAPTDAGIPIDNLTPVRLKRHTLGVIRRKLNTASVKMNTAQRRYKEDFDKKVRFTPEISVGDMVYVDRPSKLLTAAERSDIETYEDDVSRKLLPKAVGPFEVKEANDHTVVIHRDGLLVPVSLDRVTKVPSGSPVVPRTDPTRDNEGTEPGLLYGYTTDVGTDREFPIERIVRHEHRDDGTYYTVRWYGYEPTGDTVLRYDELSDNAKALYWRQQNRLRQKPRTTPKKRRSPRLQSDA